MGSLGQVHVDCLAVALVNVDTVKDGKSRMWQERVSPRGEGEKMKALLTAKVGTFLVVSSVLAVWTLLATQPVRAHETTLPTPNCSGLPADTFFAAPDAANNDETAAVAAVTSAIPAPSLGTKRGVGTTTREKLRYGKITIPALAAGELRVFHTSTGDVSDAVLCRSGSTRVTSRTSYSSHNSARSAATTARNASTRTTEANPSVSSARSALTTAASALTTAANALTAAGNTAAAAIASDNATTARDFADESANDTAGAFTNPLNDAAGHLDAAANAFHTLFQIRATVESGDESYVLVVALADATTEPKLAVQFHGAIEAGDAAAREGLQGALDAGEVEDRSILITAPGLLTLETTGSTDTVGTFGESPEVASGGSSGNFKIALPVEEDTTPQTLLVEGQTTTTTGSYILNMDFKVAMPDAALTGVTGVTVSTFTGWGSTAIAADDTTLQIDRSADEDYFVFEPSGSGFLTIAAANAGGATRHADTAGTLYGPMGQIATATSGNGNHFSFRVPVDMMPYLVKVTGTTGMYALRFTFVSATDQNSSDSSASVASVDCGDANGPNEICPSTGSGQQERDLYLINILEPGALYVHTTGSTDTRGVLYGPDGDNLGDDDNSGQRTNFRIAASVSPGLHVIEVRGQNRQTQGAYGLVSNFVTGAEVEGPTTTTPPESTTPSDADPTGVLDEPADGGTRSGIGLIRGWVCQDDGDGVEIRITGPSGSSSRTRTITALYGSDRGDVNVDNECDDKSTTDVGFAVQYNYNILDAGTYTIQAFVGTEQIGRTNAGQTNGFRVIRISDEEFLEGASRTVVVEDFPRTGDTTSLRWDESSQNFQILHSQ